MTTETAFDGALTRRTAWLVMEDAPPRELPGWRWRRGADEVDHLMVRRCQGPTLDVGCGPGRLTEALRSNGTPALGIDVSMTAVRMTGRRGGQVLRADVFGSLPDEGGWAHVLLADGNVGIGGDPHALLTRIRQLLRPAGSVIVETDWFGLGMRCGRARIGAGRPFPWALVGADAIAALAEATGFRLVWQLTCGGRWFAEARCR